MQHCYIYKQQECKLTGSQGGAVQVSLVKMVASEILKKDKKYSRRRKKAIGRII